MRSDKEGYVKTGGDQMNRLLLIIVLMVSMLLTTGCEKPDLVTLQNDARIIDISHNGDQVLYTLDESLYLYNMVNSSSSIIDKVFKGTNYHAIPQTWSDNQKEIALAYPNGNATFEINIFGLEDKSSHIISSSYRFHWIPNTSKFLVVLYQEGKYEAFIGETSQPNRLIRFSNGPEMYPISWPPNSKGYVAVNIYKEGEVLLGISTEDGQLIKEIGNSVYKPTWSSNGQYLAFGLIDQGKEGLWVYDVVNPELTKISDLTVSGEVKWNKNNDKIMFKNEDQVFVADLKKQKVTLVSEFVKQIPDTDVGIRNETMFWIDNNTVTFMYYERSFLTNKNWLVKINLENLKVERYKLNQSIDLVRYIDERKQLMYLLEGQENKFYIHQF